MRHLDTSILVILSYFLRLSRGCYGILLLIGLGSIFNFVPVNFRNFFMIFMGYGLGLTSLILASFSNFLLIFMGYLDKLILAKLASFCDFLVALMGYRIDLRLTESRKNAPNNCNYSSLFYVQTLGPKCWNALNLNRLKTSQQSDQAKVR